MARTGCGYGPKSHRHCRRLLVTMQSRRTLLAFQEQEDVNVPFRVALEPKPTSDTFQDAPQRQELGTLCLNKHRDDPLIRASKSGRATSSSLTGLVCDCLVMVAWSRVPATSFQLALEE